MGGHEGAQQAGLTTPRCEVSPYPMSSNRGASAGQGISVLSVDTCAVVRVRLSPSPCSSWGSRGPESQHRELTDPARSVHYSNRLLPNVQTVMALALKQESRLSLRALPPAGRLAQGPGSRPERGAKQMSAKGTGAGSPAPLAVALPGPGERAVPTEPL